MSGPRSCQGLTDLGREQATRLRERLCRSSQITLPVHIYASVVPRAIETAHILAEAFGEEQREIREECGLCSWLVPAPCDGMPVTEFQQNLAAPGGGVFRPFESVSETWAELSARTGRSLWSIAQRHCGETAVVVAHRETVVASLIAFGNLPLRPAFEVDVANASLTEWHTEEDPSAWPPACWTLARFNDNAHNEGL